MRNDDGVQLRLQVRRVVDRHHHGITVQGIGNELGIDWRRLVAVTRQLVDAGALDQVGHELYPVGKASPRW
jgi:hypothetical protein